MSSLRLALKLSMESSNSTSAGNANGSAAPSAAGAGTSHPPIEHSLSYPSFTNPKRKKPESSSNELSKKSTSFDELEDVIAQVKRRKKRVKKAIASSPVYESVDEEEEGAHVLALRERAGTDTSAEGTLVPSEGQGSPDASAADVSPVLECALEGPIEEDEDDGEMYVATSEAPSANPESLPLLAPEKLVSADGPVLLAHVPSDSMHGPEAAQGVFSSVDSEEREAGVVAEELEGSVTSEDQSERERRAERKRSKKGSRQRKLNDELGGAWALEDLLGPELTRQSSRAAALAAKTKMRVKPPSLPQQLLPSKDRDRRDKEEEDEDKKAQWVLCDRCAKWRKLPAEVDPESLPETWECSMMTWLVVPVSCVKEEVPMHVRGSEDDAERDAKPPVAAAPSQSRRAKSGSSRRKPVAPSEPEEEEADAAVASSAASVPAPTAAHSQTHKKKSRAAPVGEPQARVVLENITWVECHACHKWRKVPGHINADDFPEVWTCGLNYWAPLFSSCSARQEEEEKAPAQLSEPVPLVRCASGLSSGAKRGRSQGNEAPVSATKKVTQWVQCERKSCSKWRKVPTHIDMSTFSDNWYCEHNFWDLEKNKCSVQEDSDSEDDAQQATDAMTQLILANSKGPGQLSYRRLIFGPDGRMKPQYSEKNKWGYGIFSFTELNKNSEGDEQVPPTKKICYWSSDCYDQSGAQFITAYKKKKYSAQNLNKRVEQERLLDQEHVHTNGDAEVTAKSVKVEGRKPTHLLDCIRRYAKWEAPTAAHPLMSKALRKYQEMTLQRKLTLLFTTLMDKIANSTFLDPCIEVCRRLMGHETLKDTIRVLENAGEAEVTENVSGDRFVRLVAPERTSTGNLLPVDAALEQLSHFPLKFRKLKYASAEEAI